MSSDRSHEERHIALFTDIAAGERGKVANAELAGRHREVAIEVLRRIGGVEARATTTGVAATFSDANRALICAVQIQRSFEEWGSAKTAPVRVGICRDGEDAIAVAAQAGGGEIIVTESVRALTEPRGHLFTAKGERRPADATVPLFAVRWWEHD